MSRELIARLRENAETGKYDGTDYIDAADEIEQLHADLASLKQIDKNNSSEEWGYVLPDNRVLSGGWKTPNDAIAGMEKRLGREALPEWSLAKIIVTTTVVAKMVACR